MITARMKKAMTRLRHATIDEATGVALASHTTFATCTCCGDINLVMLNREGELFSLAIMTPEAAAIFARELLAAAEAARRLASTAH